MIDIDAKLNALLAAPMTHAVIVTYADGTARHREARSEAAANNGAVGERRKIGIPLVDRFTGASVMVVSVEVVAFG